METAICVNLGYLTVSPGQAANAAIENLVEELSQPSDLNPENGTSIPDALRLCAHQKNTLPVKIEDMDRVERELRLTALRYDAGQVGAQNFALCLEGIPDLTKKCYGKYIDKEYINKVLGTTTLMSYGAACTVTLLACEVATKLFEGAIAGAAEAGAVCWLPQTIALTQKDNIVRNLEKGEEIGLSGLLIPWSGLQGGAVAAAGSLLVLGPGVRAAETWAYRRLAAKRAAELYLKTLETKAKKGRPYSRLFYTRNQLERIIKSEFKDLVEGTSLATAEFTTQEMARVLKVLEPGDEGVLRLLISKSDAETSRKIIRTLAKSGSRTSLYEEFIKKLPDLVPESKKNTVMNALKNAGFLNKRGKVDTEKIGDLLESEEPLKELKSTLDETAKEAAQAVDEALEAVKLSRTQRAKNLVKDALKSAPCAAAGALAGTIFTSHTLGSFTPKTLEIAIISQDGEITGLRIGNILVGR